MSSKLTETERLSTTDLEGKCMALWEYHKGETEKWNGESCDCELVQGNWNCKLNPF